ncbi:MAG TPA: hypothetical protein VFI73_02030 [Candidatus Nitrosopolaris sp.]|nr:hypothetical protein [Candidatus Nitrosopolaris sp.]
MDTLGKGSNKIFGVASGSTVFIVRGDPGIGNVETLDHRKYLQGNEQERNGNG